MADSAHAWFAATALGGRLQWHQPLVATGGADSINVVFYHYPILDCPRRFVAKVESKMPKPVSFVALLAMDQMPSVFPVRSWPVRDLPCSLTSRCN